MRLRKTSRVLSTVAGLLAVVAAACETQPTSPREPVTIPSVFELVVSDSVGEPLGGVDIAARGWQGAAAWGLQSVDDQVKTDSAGRLRFLWGGTPKRDYDSVTFAAFEDSCRPHAASRAVRRRGPSWSATTDTLAVALIAGRIVAPPVLQAGAKVCARAAQPGSGVYDVLLAVDQWPVMPDDAVRGRWDIFFTTTAALYGNLEAVGTLRNDTLDLQLGIAKSFRCAPGYRLVAVLQQGRVDTADLTPLPGTDPVCGRLIARYTTLQFVPFLQRGWP